MSSSPSDFMDCARRLRSNAASSEVDHRAAANRAYYALYHHAQALAAQDLRYIPAENVSSHQGLIQALSDPSADRKHVSLASCLRKCRKIRVFADYVTDSEFLPRDSQEAINFAFQGLRIS